MNDVELNFVYSIKSLEQLNQDYIQARRNDLELSSKIQVGTPTFIANPIATSSVITSGSSIIVINDYVRMCRIYFIMLWTYWESLGIKSSNLDELQLIRNCLVHHGGDVAKYSQDTKGFAAQGVKLLSLVKNKSFFKNYNLIFEDIDLSDFTKLVKVEFTSITGSKF